MTTNDQVADRGHVLCNQSSALDPIPNHTDRVKAVLAPRVVREVARQLTEQGIEVMPIKGVVLQRLVYANPAARRLSDVDLLVRASDFLGAIECLRVAGYAPVSVGRSLVEVALRSPLGLTVDLHRQLFGARRYRLGTEDVFARSRLNTDLFGAPVRLAAALDTFAHLVGKWVSDHARGDDCLRLRDLEGWVRYGELEPTATAEHLNRVGMARAARYVLGHAAARSDLSFFREVVERLGWDVVGAACVRMASWAIGLGAPAPLASASAHLLNSSLGAAAGSCCAALVRRRAHPLVQSRWMRSSDAMPFGL